LDGPLKSLRFIYGSCKMATTTGQKLADVISHVHVPLY
jgi:hypothetical protein